jgi:subtilisin family serine protease
VKLALGEAPPSVPAYGDVRTGALPPAERIDGGPVDRALRRFAGSFRATRLHTAAAAHGRTGRRHVGYSALEQALGLSRTLKVELSDLAAVGDVVHALRNVGVVESATPHYLCSVPFALSAARPLTDDDEAWAPRLWIRALEAMAYEPGDPAVIVAIVDTGVHAGSPDLEGRLRTGFDTVDLVSRDVASGVDLVGDNSGIDNDPEDLVGHGTSCAGIIGARGEGLPPGLAGLCGLLPVRVLGAARTPGRSEPVGLGSIPDIDAGVKRAVDLGAKVLNMSFGTPAAALDDGDPPVHADVVRYALTRGCVLVAASGNSGRPEDYLPAALDGVIAVGAVDGRGEPAAFSTSGPHVALCAPGERVVSLGLDGLARVTGTSFAAPFVAAAAALLVSRAGQRAQSLDGADVRRLLVESAAPWSAAARGAGHGAGVLDVLAALQALERELDRRTEPEGLPEQPPTPAIATRPPAEGLPPAAERRRETHGHP